MKSDEICALVPYTSYPHVLDWMTIQSVAIQYLLSTLCQQSYIRSVGEKPKKQVKNEKTDRNQQLLVRHSWLPDVDCCWLFIASVFFIDRKGPSLLFCIAAGLLYNFGSQVIPGNPILCVFNLCKEQGVTVLHLVQQQCEICNNPHLVAPFSFQHPVPANDSIRCKLLLNCESVSKQPRRWASLLIMH